MALLGGGSSTLSFLLFLPPQPQLFCPAEQNKDVIERKGCLPRAQCPLLGHTTYWSRSYTLQHQCCEQDLCNTAASQRPPSLPLMTLLPLAAIFGWGVHIVL